MCKSLVIALNFSWSYFFLTFLYLSSYQQTDQIHWAVGQIQRTASLGPRVKCSAEERMEQWVFSLQFTEGFFFFYTCKLFCTNERRQIFTGI